VVIVQAGEKQQEKKPDGEPHQLSQMHAGEARVMQRSGINLQETQQGYENNQPQENPIQFTVADASRHVA
jgi:hypothetical protein